NSNYSDYFNSIIDEGKKGKHNHLRLDAKSILKKIKTLFNKEPIKYDLKRSLDYTVAEKFIRLFFPKTIGDNVDFCEWILENFRDANSFVNPRTLIHFFNELIHLQIQFYKKNPINIERKLVAV